MSFLHPEPLPLRSKISAVLTIVLMMPVLLDGMKLIELGSFKFAPFALALAVSASTWRRNRAAGETSVMEPGR